MIPTFRLAVTNLDLRHHFAEDHHDLVLQRLPSLRRVLLQLPFRPLQGPPRISLILRTPIDANQREEPHPLGDQPHQSSIQPPILMARRQGRS